SYWENSAPSVSVRSCPRCEIAQPRPKRRALSRYPLKRAKYLLYARATAATPKPTAAANARLNRVVHMSRSMIAGGAATGLSATGACIVAYCSRGWLRLGLICWIVHGRFTVFRDHPLFTPFRY